MKMIIESVVSLVVGLALGWYVGHQRTMYKVSEAVSQSVKLSESNDAVEALRSIKVIGLIETGQEQEAVKLLSQPLAHYYAVYEVQPGITNQRSQLRSAIESMASSNVVVRLIVNGSSKSATSGKAGGL